MKIASLNIRRRTSTTQGFRCEKWNEMYRVMNTHRLAVLAVQETHLTDELVDNIRLSFDSRIALFHSPLPDTRNAAGVAIVVNKTVINANKVSCEEIIPGRAILATIQWHANTELKVLNVYAPNDTKTNELFWERLNTLIVEKPHWKPDVLLGDFNLVEDSLDRLPCHHDDASAVATGGGSQFPDLVNHKYTVRRWIVFSQ